MSTKTKMTTKTENIKLKVNSKYFKNTIIVYKI